MTRWSRFRSFSIVNPGATRATTRSIAMIRNVFALFVALAFAGASVFAQTSEDSTKASGAAPASAEAGVNNNPLQNINTFYSTLGGTSRTDIRITPIFNAEGVPKAKVYMGEGQQIRCRYGEREVVAKEEGDKFILQPETGYPTLPTMERFEAYCRGLTVKITLPKDGGTAIVDFTSTAGGGTRGNFYYNKK